VKSRHARLLLSLLGMHSASCVALGYHFDEYGPASAASAGSAGSASNVGLGHASGGAAGEATATTEGGDDITSAGHTTGGYGEQGEGPLLTPFAAGGGPGDQTTLADGAGGQGEGGQGGSGGEGVTECKPRGCWEAEAQCGPLDDGCGEPLDCGPCFWWFEECLQNRCVIP
jgi:hypothetical protein